MIQLFETLSLIPELIIGMVHRPRLTFCVIVASAAVVVAVVCLRPESQKPVSADTSEQHAVVKERRITKIVRWLWKQE